MQFLIDGDAPGVKALNRLFTEKPKAYVALGAVPTALRGHGARPPRVLLPLVPRRDFVQIMLARRSPEGELAQILRTN